MQKGDVIEGKYRIIDVLGKGGMSTVYLAENIKLGTLWAVKAISKTSDSRMDLLAEPNILKRLSHPALPRVFDIRENQESIYIIVDYIEGKPLDYELEKAGCFSEEITLKWAKQLCEVLIYLHEFKPNPIIYRDMKPSNIIIDKSGNVKLIDFGIAREYKEQSDTDTVYIGTRGYAAPEQYGFGQTNMSSDIYSLGITLFYIITGRNPNYLAGEVKPLRYYNAGISPELEAIISRCTRQNPEERFQTARELLNVLEAHIYQTYGCRNSVSSQNYSIKVPDDYRKIIGFTGDRAAGTTVLIAAIGEFFNKMEKKVAIIDLTKSRKLYSIYGWSYNKKGENKEECDENIITGLLEGKQNPLIINKSTSIYTSSKFVEIEHNKYINMLESVRYSNDIILIDMDFETDQEIIRYLDQLYIVKDMDMYNISKTSDYYFSLKKKMSNFSKVRFIINKYIKSSIKAKSIVDTITVPKSEQETSLTDRLLDRRPVYFTIPFEIENYRLITESINQTQFSYSGFNYNFKKAIREIAESIYPIKNQNASNKRLINIFSILKGTGENEF
jgi:serine/threonine protein kinase